MFIFDLLLIALLMILSFIAGLRLDNYYNTKAARQTREALEKQYVRLRANSDADDPCRPYGIPPVSSVPIYPQPMRKNPIDEAFMKQLKQTGRAKTSFRKSDLVR